MREPIIEIDLAKMALYIHKKTKIDLETVLEVLEVEFHYLAANGFAKQ